MQDIDLYMHSRARTTVLMQRKLKLERSRAEHPELREELTRELQEVEKSLDEQKT